MFREVRLRALKDAPYAFGSTWDQEKDRSEQAWREAVASRVRLVAARGDQVIGMAAVGPSMFSGEADVTSFWVAPHARGKGVGDSLLLAVAAWAQEGGYHDLFLWVTDGNAPAEKLYERHGFRRTGAVQIVRPGAPRLEYEMSRTVMAL